MSDAALLLKVFISYSHKDESFKDELRDHLSALVQEGKVVLWHDRNIEAGTEWDAEIAAKLDAAEIVLLLVSPSFMASPYIHSQELSRAKEHHQAGTARVIPIILRPVDFKGTLIEDLQALPKNAKPITKWDDRDEAYLDAIQGIRRVVEKGQAAGLAHTATQDGAEPSLPTATASGSSSTQVNYGGTNYQVNTGSNNTNFFGQPPAGS